MAELIEVLKRKQGDLSDYTYAEMLGVSQQLWQMTRSGKRDIGLTLLKAAAKAHPELAKDVLIFLGCNVNDLTKVLGDLPSAPETSPSQNLGSLWGRLISFFTKPTN